MNSPRAEGDLPGCAGLACSSPKAARPSHSVTWPPRRPRPVRRGPGTRAPAPSARCVLSRDGRGVSKTVHGHDVPPGTAGRSVPVLPAGPQAATTTMRLPGLGEAFPRPHPAAPGLAPARPQALSLAKLGLCLTTPQVRSPLCLHGQQGQPINPLSAHS